MRLRAVAEQRLLAVATSGGSAGYLLDTSATDPVYSGSASLGSGSNDLSVKAHAFVAMAFSTHMNDVFHYGIEAPIHGAGLLCERMDHVTFTGEIVEWMRHKIETAAVVVAELSGANPNVYLEVGYAWGKGRPTILLASKVEELAFDVRVTDASCMRESKN